MSRFVEADLSYYRPAADADPRVKPKFLELPLAKERVRIEEARDRRDEFSLDEHGFQLITWPGRTKNYRDPDDVTRHYVPEVEALLKRVTGCSKVVTSGAGFVRISDRVGQRPPNTFITGNFVHADYSKNAGPFWLSRSLTPEEAELRRKKRYSIFNVWRVVSDPPQDVPLALCDARSVAPRDVVHTDFTTGVSAGGPINFENATYRYNENHRWYYFRDMTRDETLVFRGFDSDKAREEAVPHTAFEHPTCPASAPPRESIEIRSVVFYD